MYIHTCRSECKVCTLHVYMYTYSWDTYTHAVILRTASALSRKLSYMYIGCRWLPSLWKVLHPPYSQLYTASQQYLCITMCDRALSFLSLYIIQEFEWHKRQGDMLLLHLMQGEREYWWVFTSYYLYWYLDTHGSWHHSRYWKELNQHSIHVHVHVCLGCVIKLYWWCKDLPREDTCMHTFIILYTYSCRRAFTRK